MDLSDLPQSAQDRIAAAEIEADTILASSNATANRLMAQARNMGVDPSGIGYSPGDIPLNLAESVLAEGWERAAGQLFGATAGEFLKNGKLDIEEFRARLETIGDWIAKKYRIDRTVLNQLKEHCRGVALRMRAAATEAAASASAQRTEPPISSASHADVTREAPAGVGERGRKRGPTPDHKNARLVARIVADLAPDGAWRAKLDDICGALDKDEIPFPKTWRKRDRSCSGWADYDERANAVKAIEYRLGIAMGQKKTGPETLS